MAQRPGNAVVLTAIGMVAFSLFSSELFSQTSPEKRLPGFVEGLDEMTDSEASVLDSSKSRHDLPCTVSRARFRLGYDLRFVGWFRGWIRRDSLHPETRTLTISYRVSSESHPDQVLFLKGVARPTEAPPEMIGFQGVFLTGEGKYRLDWMIVDDLGRVCSGHDRIKAKLQNKDVRVRLPQGHVGHIDTLVTPSKIPLSSSPENGLCLKLMLNVPPFLKTGTDLTYSRYHQMRQIIHAFAFDPRVQRMSIVAFNVRERRVLFRQEESNILDLVGFKEAVREPEAALISANSYSHQDRVRFVTALLETELAGAQSPDAVVFVGPVGFDGGSLWENMKELVRRPLPPLFYLRYVGSFGSIEGDVFSRFVKRAGGKVYYVNSPYVMWRSIDNLLKRTHTRQEMLSGSDFR